MTAWSGTGFLEVSGTPYEQGLAQGRTARGEIEDNLELVERVKHAAFGNGRQTDYDRLVRENAEYIAAASPDTMAEIEGIAAGSSLDLNLVLGLNLPVYFMAASLPGTQIQDIDSVQCTQVLLQSDMTADGSVLLAKTRDQSSGRYHQLLIKRWITPDRWVVETNTTGSITWPGHGINSDGLALSTSGVWSKRTPVDWSRVRSAWLLANTAIMLRTDSTVEDVRRSIAGHSRLTPVIITAADQTETAVFELTDQDCYEDKVSSGFAVRTNHFTNPALKDLAPTAEEYPSTYERARRATQLVESKRGTWDIASLAAVTADHEGYPQLCVCRHPQRDGDAQTLSSTIVRMSDSAVIGIVGNPCLATPLVSSDTQIVQSRPNVFVVAPGGNTGMSIRNRA